MSMLWDFEIFWDTFYFQYLVSHIAQVCLLHALLCRLLGPYFGCRFVWCRHPVHPRSKLSRYVHCLTAHVSNTTNCTVLHSKISKRPVWHPSQKAWCLTVNFPSYLKVQLRCWCQKNIRGVDQKSFWRYEISTKILPQRTEKYVQTGGVALFQNCRAVATRRLVGESQGGAIFTGSFIQTGGLGMGHSRGCCTFDGGCNW